MLLIDRRISNLEIQTGSEEKCPFPAALLILPGAIPATANNSWNEYPIDLVLFP